MRENFARPTRHLIETGWKREGKLQGNSKAGEALCYPEEGYYVLRLMDRRFPFFMKKDLSHDLFYEVFARRILHTKMPATFHRKIGWGKLFLNLKTHLEITLYGAGNRKQIYFMSLYPVSLCGKETRNHFLAKENITYDKII